VPVNCTTKQYIKLVVKLRKRDQQKIRYKIFINKSFCIIDYTSRLDLYFKIFL
jgi:hypothetical protein